MAGRFSFSVPERRNVGDPWFRIGTLEVTTTVLVVILCVAGLFIRALSLEFPAIRAPRGESWLAVRENSETGHRLYEGILARGGQKKFVRKRLWVRFGFPSNLTATLNGEPATLPSGTASVVIQGRKLRTVSLG